MMMLMMMKMLEQVLRLFTVAQSLFLMIFQVLFHSKLQIKTLNAGKLYGTSPDTRRVMRFNTIISSVDVMKQKTENHYLKSSSWMKLVTPLDRKRHQNVIMRFKNYMRKRFRSRRGDDGEGRARINLFDSTSESMSRFTYKLVVCRSQSYGCPGVDSDVDFVFIVDKNTCPKLSIFEIRSAVFRDINKQPGDYFDPATLERAPLDERQNRFNELTSPTVGLNNDIPLISMFDTKEKMQLDVTFAWSSAKRVETNDQVIKCLNFIANRRPETRNAMECLKLCWNKLEYIGRSLEEYQTLLLLYA